MVETFKFTVRHLGPFLIYFLSENSTFQCLASAKHAAPRCSSWDDQKLTYDTTTFVPKCTAPFFFFTAVIRDCNIYVVVDIVSRIRTLRNHQTIGFAGLTAHTKPWAICTINALRWPHQWNNQLKAQLSGQLLVKALMSLVGERIRILGCKGFAKQVTLTSFTLQAGESGSVLMVGFMWQPI